MDAAAEGGRVSRPSVSRAGVKALAAQFSKDQVLTYLNTLWLQDPDRWDGLRELPEPS